MTTRTRLSEEYRQVQSQLDWADGLRKTCKPFTPKDDFNKLWVKLRNAEALRWGCKLRIVLTDDVQFMEEEYGKDWEKQGEEVSSEVGYLIAIPGQRCGQGQEADGVVWVPHVRAEKEEGEPVWCSLWVTLGNPQVAWVEVVE